MKKFFLTTLTILSMLFSTAQKGPLKGSGKIVNKTFEYKDFDKVELADLDGKAEIEIGKPFAVSVAVDDNLESLLNITEKNGELRIELTGNLNNRMYIEETNISIKITMPEISVLKHRGNGNLYVTGITGRCFRIKNSGNGNAFLKGSIDELNIVCYGNGTVKAEELLAKSIKINKSGNGNVYVNANNPFTANGSGNGDIINKGKGKADAGSNISGNGEIKYPNEEKTNSYVLAEKSKLVAVTIRNQSDKWIYLSVKYPVKGNYGIDVKAKDSITESFPAGTKIYKGNRFTTFKKPIYIVTEEKNNQTFIIKPE